MGLILWGSPILVIGLVPNAGLAVAVMVVLGAGNAILDVAGFTLLQRSVPNAVRGRVFGILETIVMLGLAAGSALAPVLVAVLGLQGALIATGLLPDAGHRDLAGDPPHRWPGGHPGSRDGHPARRPDAPLPAADRPGAGGGQRASRPIHGGQPDHRPGEAGDSFYVLAEGKAAASVDGQTVRHMQSGDSFGEIALLETSRAPPPSRPRPTARRTSSTARCSSAPCPGTARAWRRPRTSSASAWRPFPSE